MENESELIINHDKVKCSNCFTDVEIKGAFCPSCGFPEKGTEKEKAVFHANKVMDKNKHMDASVKVNSARNTLYVISGITFLSGIVYYFITMEFYILFVNTIIGVLYLVLALWSVKQPLPALLSALLLYATIFVLNGLLDPSTIYQGLILKVIVLVYLGKGLYSAKAAQQQIVDKSDNA